MQNYCLMGKEVFFFFKAFITLFTDVFLTNYHYRQFPRTYLDMPAIFIEKSIASKLNKKRISASDRMNLCFIPPHNWGYTK